MLHELMLYSPHREEFEMEEVIEKYNELHNEKRKVDTVKSQVMEYLEDVEEARYFVELAKAEIGQDLDLEETANKMDPQKEQDDADCIAAGGEEDEEHLAFGNLNPDLYDLNEDVPKAGFYKKIDIPDLEEGSTEYNSEIL